MPRRGQRTQLGNQSSNEEMVRVADAGEGGRLVEQRVDLDGLAVKETTFFLSFLPFFFSPPFLPSQTYHAACSPQVVLVGKRMPEKRLGWPQVVGLAEDRDGFVRSKRPAPVDEPDVLDRVKVPAIPGRASNQLFGETRWSCGVVLVVVRSGWRLSADHLKQVIVVCLCIFARKRNVSRRHVYR